MKNEELEYRVNIILKEELTAYSSNGRGTGGLGSYSVGISTTWTSVGRLPTFIHSTASEETVYSKNETLLLKLYNSLGTKDKERFKAYLKSLLDRKSELNPVAYLVFRVLYKLDETLESLEYARSNLRDKGMTTAKIPYSNVLAILSQTMIHEYAYHDWKWLRELKAFIESETDHSFSLKERINAAEIKILESELADVNPEINRDREKVKSLWDQKFHNNKITVLIDEVEEHFIGGELTSAKFATCMGRVRVLLMEVAKQVAQNVATGSKDELPKGDKPVLKYLNKKKVTSIKEHGLLSSIYDLTSDAGSHASDGLREQARLTKNIVYEAILMLLNRLV